MATLSAGTARDADNPLTANCIAWADTIFAMEDTHRRIIRQRFKSAIGETPIVVLGIRDAYAFMQPALVELLEARMRRWLLN